MPDPTDPTGEWGPTLDASVLADLRDALGDDGLVVEVIDAFLSETPPHIAALATAHEQADDRALVSAAHLIRGGALTLGATRLASVCAMLEAAQGDSSPWVVAAVEEYADLAGALADYRSTVAPRT